MTLAELRQTWEDRRVSFAKFDALVNGAMFSLAVLADLDELEASNPPTTPAPSDARTLNSADAMPGSMRLG